MKLSNLAPAALLLLSGSIFAQANAAGDAAAGGIAEPSTTTQETDAALPDEDTTEGSLTITESVAQPDFATADSDRDGLLSISEIDAAMPGVNVVDKNGDGFVNQDEVELAVTGLTFETEGYTGGSALVTEPEYDLIVSKLGTDAPAGTRDTDN